MARNQRGHYLGAEQAARIEIIPMIDVMMFLLVFFVLIMLEMIQGAGISLDLPQSSTAQQLETVKLTIGVTKEGAIFLDGQPIAEADLTAKLRELAGSKKVDVVISGDKNGAYQNIIKVMDLVRAAGISAIGLATAT
jgi:biopolymer transport protein ExbD